MFRRPGAQPAGARHPLHQPVSGSRPAGDGRQDALVAAFRSQVTAALAAHDGSTSAALDGLAAAQPSLTNLLAVEYARAGALEQARALLQSLVAAAPGGDILRFLNNLVYVEQERGDYEAAWGAVRQLLAMHPDTGCRLAAAVARSAMLGGAQDIFWAANAAVRALRPDDIRAWSAAYIAGELRLMPGEERPVRHLAIRQAPLVRQVRHRPEPLRLALIGSDFGSGTSMNRTLGPFRRLPELGFEVHCLWLRDGVAPDMSGFPGARLTQVPEGNADALRSALAEIAPDVTIDLAYHGQPDSFRALAQRTSPLQLGWSGNGVSAGVDVFDAILTDRFHCPPGAERHYVERIIRIPVHSVTVEPYPSYPDCSELPADRNGHVTFGAFHRLSKLSPAVLSLWAEVLDAVPGSRLRIKTFLLDIEEIASRIRAAFVERGTDPGRLELLGGTDHETHCRAAASVDIALGPFPEQGNVTDFDSFWMGVPTIGYSVDDRPCARTAGVISAAAGAAFLTVGSPEAYVATARDLAAERDYLRISRGRFRQNILESGLTDHDATARALATAIRRLWAELPPAG